MLYFKAILLIILSGYLATCVVVFSYHKIIRLPRFWRNMGMTIFFIETCYYFGVKPVIISLLYLSVCAVTFILRALLNEFSPQTNSADDDKTFYSGLLLRRYASLNYRMHSNPLVGGGTDLPALTTENGESDALKLNQLLLCVLVPLWLSCFLAYKTYRLSYGILNSIYPNTFRIKNKIITILKSIKAL
jgi:hypothetical protein